MAQNSASGSGLVTDYVSVGFGFEISGAGEGPGSAPGEYYAVGGLIGLLTGLVPITPGSELSGLTNGVQTREGRIGRARAIAGVLDSVGGARRFPTRLQFQLVDHETGLVIPQGNEVSIPWGPETTLATNFSQLGNLPLNFGSVRWQAGDLYLLKVTVGDAEVGLLAETGNQLIIVSYETVLVALAPLPGPLGSPGATP